MQFVAKVRKTGDSLGITIPNTIVEGAKLKEGTICQFIIQKADFQESSKIKKE